MPGDSAHLPGIFIVDNTMHQPSSPGHILGWRDAIFERLWWSKHSIVHCQRLKDVPATVLVETKRCNFPDDFAQQNEAQIIVEVACTGREDQFLLIDARENLFGAVAVAIEATGAG